MALSDTQLKIESKFQNSDGFFPYIEDIRFPMYKSLQDGLTLPLDWPIVALVGPNGTNKSSVLQAISAAPDGRSLAQFWFSTEVDDIDRGVRGKATHRFIYRYRFDKSGTLAECRKYRGSKPYRSADVPKSLRGKRDPDYWEPTKRVAGDNMAELPATGFDARLSGKRDRWNQIKKEVVYLDFRSELSAFDKYIHHQSFDHWTPDATQKRYRAVVRSKWIAKALDGLPLPREQAGKLIESVRDLDQAEVDTIAEILGKPITRISVVNHRFFGPTGMTVRLHLSGTGASYSEAHAGSGEYAVVRLVDAIRKASARSLILLDEPEVSLHPGAQVLLMRFIEQEVLKRGHQVVISTHSPTVAAALPQRAIKVFGFDTTRQRVVLVANGCSATEAFAHLGHTTTASSRPRLIVEDELAAELVRASLRRHNPTKLDVLDIVPFPGGADGIVRNVLSTVALAGVGKTSILLDGDQRPSTANPARDVRADADSLLANGDKAAMLALWSEEIHKTPPYLHSDSGGTRDPENLHACISWAGRHLGYLPGKTPEEAAAKALDPGATAAENDWKGYWSDKVTSDLHLTPSETVSADQILNSQRIEVAALPKDCELLHSIYETVDRIILW